MMAWEDESQPLRLLIPLPSCYLRHEKYHRGFDHDSCCGFYCDSHYDYPCNASSASSCDPSCFHVFDPFLICASFDAFVGALHHHPTMDQTHRTNTSHFFSAADHSFDAAFFHYFCASDHHRLRPHCHPSPRQHHVHRSKGWTGHGTLQRRFSPHWRRRHPPAGLPHPRMKRTKRTRTTLPFST